MKGTCLCGAVQYEVTGTPTAFDLCHCSRCREASGSAFIAELVFEAAEIEWVSGEDRSSRPTRHWYASNLQHSARSAVDRCLV
jgi:hypothetical protein